MSKGVLVQCDASIKAIIVRINSERHDYVIEELDEETVIVHENKLADLKERLNDVRHSRLPMSSIR